MKAVFLFPGQGSQYVGMGKELADSFPAAKQIFDQAAAHLGTEYVDVIFSGPEEKLRQTRYTQPALFIMSAAALEILKSAHIQPIYTAGHSLGEYSALYAAGAFDFKTGLDLVRARGEAIDEASSKIPGTMAAIIGLDRAKVSDICQQASSKGVCEPVNLNGAGQIVIAGSVEAVDSAVQLAQAAGALKALKLSVSGPFHSSLMKPAAEKMAAVLEKASIRDAAVPVITNCDALPTRSAADIRQKLVRQIDHAVLWEDGMKFLLSNGADTFIEVGAGRVLSGILKRMDKTKKLLNIEDKKSADALAAQLTGA
jgi:[acyl-carrier-protein] S-malonyltransferase